MKENARRYIGSPLGVSSEQAGAQRKERSFLPGATWKGFSAEAIPDLKAFLSSRPLPGRDLLPRSRPCVLEARGLLCQNEPCLEKLGNSFKSCGF